MLWFLGASSENKLLFELFWQPWSLLWLSLRTSGCLKQVGSVLKRSSFFTKISGELSKANIVWFASIFSFKIVFLITHVFWHEILEVFKWQIYCVQIIFWPPCPPWPDAGVLLYSAAIAPPDGRWWPKLELKTGKVGICFNNSRVSNWGIISKETWARYPETICIIESGYRNGAAICKKCSSCRNVWSPGA